MVWLSEFKHNRDWVIGNNFKNLFIQVVNTYYDDHDSEDPVLTHPSLHPGWVEAGMLVLQRLSHKETNTSVGVLHKL